jgi:hypothetical protein
MCEQSVLSGFMLQSDKNVSRETVLSDWGRKPYKTTSIAQGETRAIARKLGLFGGWLVRPRAAAALVPKHTF